MIAMRESEKVTKRQLLEDINSLRAELNIFKYEQQGKKILKNKPQTILYLQIKLKVTAVEQLKGSILQIVMECLDERTGDFCLNVIKQIMSGVKSIQFIFLFF